MQDLSTYPIADLRIRVEVQDRLYKARGRTPFDIAVVVDHGTVSLEGRVFSEVERTQAVEAAATVEGVTCVRDAMILQA